jgi:hypothetical protein
MKCPKCKRGQVMQQVNVVVECPADCNDLSKKGIRKNNVKIMGVLWDQATWYCDKGCGYTLRLGKR